MSQVATPPAEPVAVNGMDLGMLAWCAPEVRQALESAVSHLGRQLEDGDGDVSLLAMAQKSVHQAHGALAMVNVPGAVQITAEAEGLIERMVRGELTPSADLTNRIGSAFNALSEYLDDLVRGKTSSPLWLFSALQGLLEARKAERIHPADLFYPQLVQWTPLAVSSTELDDDERHAIRVRFEQGLLGSLRDARDRKALTRMASAVEELARSGLVARSATFWAVLAAYFRALVVGQLVMDARGKRLLARINLQLRQTLKDGSPAADRLLRDTLFSIACGSPDASELKPVFDAFSLAGLVPDGFDKPRYGRIDRRALAESRDAVLSLKKVWELMLSQPGGIVEYLGEFRGAITRFRDGTETLGVSGLDELARGWVGVAKHLSVDSGPVIDTLGVEVAISMLFAEELFESGIVDFVDLSGRSAELTRRMEAVMQGSALPAELPVWLRELHATVQDRLTMFAFIGELRADLREAESALDHWNREPGEAHDSLHAATARFNEIGGVMRLFAHDAAGEAANWLSTQAGRLAAGDMLEDEALANLATSVGSLGFFIDAMASDPATLPHFVFDAHKGVFERQALISAEPEAAPIVAAAGHATNTVAVTTVAVAAGASASVADEGVTAAVASAQSAEEVLATRQLQLDDALMRWSADAGSETGRLEVAELLQNICDSAQLVDAADLLAIAQAAIPLANGSALDDRREVAIQIAVRFGRPAALLPAAQPAQPAAALPEAEAAVDEELLEIFLAEATEVLEAIASAERVLVESRNDAMTLTTVRRSFHTLKGSSRMVGLDAFGAAAWSLEQLLNLWMSEERSADDSLLSVISEARILFSDWVAALEAGASHAQRPDPTLVVAKADALRSGNAGGGKTLTAKPIVGGPVAPALIANASAALLSDDVCAEPVAVGELSGEVPAANEYDEPVDSSHALAVPADIETADIETADIETADIETVDIETADIETAGALTAQAIFSPSVSDETVRIGEREIKAQLFRIFSEEATTLHAVLQLDAADWQEQPTRKAADAARRAMHSLRGSAGLVQAEPARTLAASLERFLSLQIASPRQTTHDDVAQYTHLVGELGASLTEFLDQCVPIAREEAIAAADALHARWQPGGSDPVALVPAEAMPEVESRPTVPDAHDGPLLKDEFDEELLPLFVTEAEEYLPEIDANMRAWLKEPDNAKLQQLIMRQLHTVKGSARMAGAMVLGQRVHDMETRVESAMALPSVPTAIIEQLMTEQDLVTEQFEYIRDPSLKSQVQSVAAAHEASGQPLATAMAATSIAPVRSASTSAGTLTASPSSAGTEGADTPDAARQTQPLIRVRAEVLDKLVNEAGEITIARSRLDNSVGGLRQTMSELAENVNRLRTHLREIEMQGEVRIASGNGAAPSQPGGEFDPLEFDRYTRFQELTRMLAEAVNDVSTVHVNATRAIDEALADLGRQGHTLRQLQHNLLGIRMVQFGTINDRLYRVVRQVAKAQGKRVSLDIRGATVQMDRGVLERMIAPIEHLLRNAVSHGIEEPAQRVAAGKPETGDIRLEIAQEGNEIMLALSDDGGGLDLARIRDRGIERGLISTSDDVTEETLSDLIFMPGFTTARLVDQISGRGVGMDVVRSEVGLLGGRVQVGTTTGQGSRFTVHLPLTMAIEQVMMVSIGEGRWSVPAASVEQILQLDPEQLARAYEKRSIEWQDEAVPLYWFASLVGQNEHQPLAQHHAPVMIVRSAGRRIAVHADAVSKAQEVVVKNVGPQVAKVPGVAGATVMGNGDVVLILNVGQLASRLSEKDQDAAMRAGIAAGLAVAPPCVMVVDDSVTVRKVTQRFLARESFDVLLAKDGVDALRQLEDRRPDVMLVDIEMPRMDGFDLTRAVRRDERFKHIPIVMITSRTADKHRNFALELGVNEYLGKPYDEATLLGLVNQYVVAQRVR